MSDGRTEVSNSPVAVPSLDTVLHTLPSYDSIVVGLGAMGSATVYQLAKQGQQVLGLEMFEPGHSFGSSHGFHRMIRRSAIHDDGYVPLAERAFELWDELEQESGQTLLTVTGEVTLVDPAAFPDVHASVAKMEACGFWEPLSEASLNERFPGFRLDDGMSAHYEANAGFLWSELGIQTHVEMAKAHGATIRSSEEVTGWTADGQGVEVTTKNGVYRADQLILTTGAYAAELLKELDLPFQVIRNYNGYFEPSRPEWWRAEQGAPDFLLYIEEGSFYGMPAIDDIGLKIGITCTEPANPRTIRRTVDASEIQQLRDALDRYMPGAAGKELRHLTCMDAYTVDGGFIVDRHPEHEQVLIGCGFSGRGFKFSPVIGEILANLAIDGETRHEVGFMRLGREGLGTRR